MDKKTTGTLLELAAKSLLSNELAALHALDELPRALFVPLFIPAFLGRHKEILKAMVRVWPFHCLHIGTLSVQGSDCDILEAMIDGLQLHSAQNSSSWGSKLRLLDLRQDPDCKIICSEFGTTFSSCFQSCAYSRNSTLRTEGTQHSVRCPGFDDSESEPHSASETVELLVDLSLDGTLRTWQFVSFLQSKLRQSFGSLHLCCRDLEIFDMSADRSILQFLDPRCISNLQVDLVHLREVNTLVAQTVYLYRLRLSDIHFTCFAGRQLQTFLHCLRNLDSLQELDLSTLYVRNRLHRFLRVLPPQLKTLNLSSCGLSSIDVTILSQSSQATHLSQLNLSHNQIFSTAHGPFQTLLERASGTLQHLQINNCVLTDSILSALLPALSHCSCLRVLSFAFNPITMPMLMSLLQHLKSLMELKYVIYSIPLHCYRDWDVPDGLDQQQLAEVEAQLKAMLQAVQRDDMIWTTCPVKFP
ncbi:melanoma antigen preferentially expressed in tumors-like [Manis pentadactyla]|uniref:melanoma antigen preferentially expressed in tumors-like n=1 Tax=Manis pentadactyla TaxID=143292 RepID=UPI00255CF2AE|nr:melanoma antigen preferentially expressed in tumors-like [Manis pentadactyla]